MEGFDEMSKLMVSLPKELSTDIWRRFLLDEILELKVLVDVVEELTYDLSLMIRFGFGEGDDVVSVVSALKYVLSKYVVTVLISAPCNHLDNLLSAFDCPFPVEVDEDEPDIQFVLDCGTSRDFIVGNSEAEDWEFFDILISAGGVYVCATLYTRLAEELKSRALKLMCCVKVLGNDE